MGRRVDARIVKPVEGGYKVKTREGEIFAIRDKVLWRQPCRLSPGDRVQVEINGDNMIVYKHRRPSACRVAILGLAGDPVTNGHIGLAQAVGESGHFDEVWLMPCYSHPFGKQMALPWYRYLWCKMAVSKLPPKYVVSRYEIFKQHTGNTFELMQRMQQEMPKFRFHWIIGSDNVLNINKWAHATELKDAKAIPFVVVPRLGYEMPSGTGWYDFEPHIHLKDHPWSDGVSSTDVRKMLAASNSAVKDLIDPDVYKHIMTNKIRFKQP